jgi:general secretion pathway protein A
MIMLDVKPKHAPASVIIPKKNPFALSPDPQLFYSAPQFIQCLRSVESSIRLRQGLSMVIGDVGSGKTTIGRVLLQSFMDKPDYLFRMILDPEFENPVEFMNHVTQLFGIKTTARTSLEFKETIQNYLYTTGISERKIPVLIIDEGQKLSVEVMETLRTYLNFETNEYKLLQVLILSQNEILDRIRMIPNFLDRISTACYLKPLTEKEMKNMIEHRLRQISGKPTGRVFSRKAINQIYSYSHGYPRKAIRLCQQLYLNLIQSKYKTISDKRVVETIQSFEAHHA